MNMNKFFETIMLTIRESFSWTAPARLEEVKVRVHNQDQYYASYHKPDRYRGRY